jgi:hypothetical protein
MKTFRYVHRDKQGVRRQGTVTAAGLSEATKTLQVRGIVPISLTECSAPQVLQGPPLFSRSVKRQMGLLLVVLLGAVAVTIWALKRRDVRDEANRSATVSPPPATRVPVSDRARPESRAVATVASTIAPGTNRPRSTADSGDQARAREPGVRAAIEIATRDAGTPATPLAVEEPTPPKPKLYNSSAEQILGWLANTQPGATPTFLPRMSPLDNITEILNSDIVIGEEDDAATIAAKENLAIVKQSLKEYLAEGGDPETFLTFYHDHLRESFELWRTAQKQVAELVKAGDWEAAQKYVDEQNRVFAEAGIRPVMLPKR